MNEPSEKKNLFEASPESEASDEVIHVVKSYFSHEIIAYFALKAGMVSLDSAVRNTEKEKIAKEQGIKLVPDTVSGIEISHFAINDNYRKHHHNIKGLGRYIYPSFIYPIINKCSKDIGIVLAYLYAADNSSDNSQKLVEYYKDVFEFDVLADKENALKPVTSYYDSNCIFMYKIL